MLPKGVSDNNPMRITFVVKNQIKDPSFRFKKWWLEIEEFAEVVQKAWDTDCPSSDPVSAWQFQIRNLRRKIKGWSRNREAGLKKSKTSLILELDTMDTLSEQQALTEAEKYRRKEFSLKLDRI
jgi:hypothetical protein